MMSFIAFLLTASFCPIIFTEAVLWDGARSTTHSSSRGWSPNPTPAPGVGEESARPNDLLRRQVDPNVCGSYISGTVTSGISCPTSTCILIQAHSVLGCCDGDQDHCDYHTDCIGYHENLAQCTSGCNLTTKTLTCTSDNPYCKRWTHHNGYSYYQCGTKPTVLSLATQLFTSTRLDSTATAGNVYTTAANASPTDQCEQPVPAGAIAGGIVGGLIVLAAAAIGLIYVLRHTGQQTVGPAPAPSPPAEVKPSESYPVPLGPIAPLYGYYPAVQREQQQHVVELH